MSLKLENFQNTFKKKQQCLHMQATPDDGLRKARKRSWKFR